MKISCRNFLTKVTVGVTGLSLAREFAWLQAKGKVGYMKIVDNAAMFMAMEKGFFKAEGMDLETVPMGRLLLDFVPPLKAGIRATPVPTLDDHNADHVERGLKKDFAWVEMLTSYPQGRRLIVCAR